MTQQISQTSQILETLEALRLEIIDWHCIAMPEEGDHPLLIKLNKAIVAIEKGQELAVV